MGYPVTWQIKGEQLENYSPSFHSLIHKLDFQSSLFSFGKEIKLSFRSLIYKLNRWLSLFTFGNESRTLISLTYSQTYGRSG